jgi:hypothetical protein
MVTQGIRVDASTTAEELGRRAAEVGDPAGAAPAASGAELLDAIVAASLDR